MLIFGVWEVFLAGRKTLTWLLISTVSGLLMPVLLVFFMTTGGESKEILIAVIVFSVFAWVSALVAAAIAYFNMGVPPEDGKEPVKTYEQPKKVKIGGDDMVFAAHQIKSPITGVLSVLGVLKQTGDQTDEKAREELLQQAYQRTLDLKSTVEDILELAEVRSKSGQERKIGVKQAAQKAVEMALPTAHSKDVKLISEFDNATAMDVSPDIVHAFLNLIDNAVKYSESGSKVDVTLFKDDGSCVFEVEDRGIGIPPNMIEKVFDEFWRADNARKKVSGGSGLGMSIVKDIIEREGGTIDITSDEKYGTRVTVRLKQQPLS